MATHGLKISIIAALAKYISEAPACCLYSRCMASTPGTWVFMPSEKHRECKSSRKLFTARKTGRASPPHTVRDDVTAADVRHQCQQQAKKQETNKQTNKQTNNLGMKRISSVHVLHDVKPLDRFSKWFSIFFR